MSQNNCRKLINQALFFLIVLVVHQIFCFGDSGKETVVYQRIEDAWYFIAIADLNKAEIQLASLKKDYPDDLLIKASFAYLAFEKGDYNRAEKDFAKVIQLGEGKEDIATKPESIRHAVSLAYRGLGYIFQYNGKIFEAQAFFSKSFYAFGDINSYIASAVAMRKFDSNYQASEEIHKQILENFEKGFSINRIQLAILYLAEGKKDEAKALVSEITLEGYEALDWAAYYCVSDDINKTKEFLTIYLDRYRLYPLRCQKILDQVKTDVDFENFRKMSEFKDWFITATGKYVKSDS